MRPLIAALLALCLLCPAVQAAEESPVTRAQFAGLLWEKLGAVPYDANGPFSDVDPGHPCAAAVSWLAHEGVLLGTGENRFDPLAGVASRRHLYPRRPGRLQRL